jgi:hypothetical protein
MRLFVIVAFVAIINIPVALHGQSDSAATDLSALLNDNSKTGKHEPVGAIFETTRVINGQSIEMTGKGILDFKISHRFGAINGGVSQFFGLDGAVTQLGFDYGVTKWLTVGVSRSTFNKEYEGYAKVRLLTQTEDGHMPISLDYVGAATIMSDDASNYGTGDAYRFSYRMSYMNQLLIARKFSSRLSLQLMPTILHYNLVDLDVDPNNVIAIGAGGRYKLSNRFSLNVEYYFQVPGEKLANYKNSLSVGVDIQTGGHVFQLFFTNSSGITERAFVGQTTDSWSKGQIHFGFNISRIFQIVHPKEFEGSRNSIY